MRAAPTGDCACRHALLAAPPSDAAATTPTAGRATAPTAAHNRNPGRNHRPSDLYECFTHPGRISAFTRSEARAEAAPGGAFSWFNGGVTGQFLEMAPPGRLVLEWRFSSWPDGCASRVELALAEPEAGSTVLELRQTGIPEEDRFGNHDVKIQVRGDSRGEGEGVSMRGCTRGGAGWGKGGTACRGGAEGRAALEPAGTAHPPPS